MKALKALAPNAIFILDESHNASGDSSRAWRLGPLLESAAGVFYSSATWAKRADNTGIYFKTSLGNAAASMEELAETMKGGGLPLLQAASAMLVADGQILRRERSFEGIEYDTKINFETEERDRRLADNYTTGLRSITMVGDAIRIAAEAINAALRKAVSKVIAQGGSRPFLRDKVESTNFSSKIHNLISQYLLAIKTEAGIVQSIEAIKRGEKVVVGLEKTMESALEDVKKAGYPFTFNGLLRAYLDKMKVIKTSREDSFTISGEPNPKYVQRTNTELIKIVPEITIDPLGGERIVGVKQDVVEELMRRASWDRFEATQEEIDGLDLADMPLSPIDELRRRVEQAGFKTGEITGRKTVLRARGVAANRDKSEMGQKGQLRSMRQFNDEDLDLLIINQSGATGISLHASEKFKNQSPRRMILLQAPLDINTFMQMLGRIFRSGQVGGPSSSKYTILQTALPAEFRPATIRSKKLAALNANTTSNVESAVSEGAKQDEAEDLFNRYGDEVVFRYLANNLSFAAEIARTWKGQFFLWYRNASRPLQPFLRNRRHYPHPQHLRHHVLPGHRRTSVPGNDPRRPLLWPRPHPPTSHQRGSRSRPRNQHRPRHPRMLPRKKSQTDGDARSSPGPSTRPSPGAGTPSIPSRTASPSRPAPIRP